MANKEMYDYLSSATVNFTSSALQVSPQRQVKEIGNKNQIVRFGDDGSEERITYSSNPIFYVTLMWANERSTDIGTIMDYYYSTSKGNGVSRSFKWYNHADQHTYVARFDGEFNRNISPAPYTYGIHAIPSIRLRILGTT